MEKRYSPWALVSLCIALVLTASAVLYQSKMGSSSSTVTPISYYHENDMFDSNTSGILQSTRRFLKYAVQSARVLLADDVPVPVDKRERLCVVAGTSTLDGDKTQILAESLFSFEGMMSSSSHAAHVKLFLYSNNPLLVSRFLLTESGNLTGTESPASWNELLGAEERHIRDAIDGVNALNREASPQSAFMIPILSILHSRHISNASCRRKGEEIGNNTIDLDIEMKLIRLAAARAAIANVIPFCDHILLTNGRTYFSKFFAANVMLRSGGAATTTTAIHTVTFVSCNTRRAHDQLEFQVGVSCRGNQIKSALARRQEQPQSVNYHIASSGAIVPVGLIQSKALVLKYPAYPEDAGMRCGEANLHWFWSTKGGREPPRVEVLSFKHQSEGSRGAMIYENPDDISGAQAPASVSDAVNDNIHHRKPQICAVVRTYQKERRTIRSTLLSLQTNLPPTHDIKIFVINAADLSSVEKRNAQEEWLRNDVFAPLNGTLLSSRLQLMTFASLFHKNMSAAVDMFGYVATDAVFDHADAVNCTIGIVTNGDNLYLGDFWGNVLKAFASSTSPVGGDGERTKAVVVGTFFISRYFSYDVATQFVSGRIDLGAAAFTMDVYRTVGGFSRFGQQSGYDWAYSDGKFFAKVREVVPLSSQVVVERALFVHQ